MLARTGVPVVEDDSAGAISTAPDLSLGAWLPEQTVHVRSYSKSHGPDLRLAGLSGPTELLRDALSRRQLGQGWSSRLLQRILVGLLTDDDAVAHVDRARAWSTPGGARPSSPPSPGTASTSRAPTASTSGCRSTTRRRRSSASPARASASPRARRSTCVPGGGGHIRVTSGLVPEGHEELAATLAAAANTSGWGERAR